MITYLMVFHAIISFLLILLVLIQFGKGAEAGLISGGATGEMFTGASKGNILTKITVIISIIFLGNSVFLAKMQSKYSASSLLDDETPITRPLNSDAAQKEQTPVAVPTPAETKPTTK